MNTQSDNNGTRLETEDGSSDELLSIVSELEEGRKDLERNVANLFMHNVSLVTKLKAIRAVETEQKEIIRSLEEQLVQALKTQVSMHIYSYSHHRMQCSDVLSSLLRCTTGGYY